MTVVTGSERLVAGPLSEDFLTTQTLKRCAVRWSGAPGRPILGAPAYALAGLAGGTAGRTSHAPLAALPNMSRHEHRRSRLRAS